MDYRILFPAVDVSGGFKYLVRVINSLFNDWIVLLPNISMEMKCWGHFGELPWR